MNINELRDEVNKRCKDLTHNLYLISIQDKDIYKCEDLFRWAHCMETYQYYLVKCHVGSRSQITTQFSGIDNGHYDEQGRMLIFETTVFGWDYDGYLPRYATWDEAEKGHYEFVDKVHEACLGYKLKRKDDV